MSNCLTYDGYPTDQKVKELKEELVRYLSKLRHLTDEFWRLKFVNCDMKNGKTIYIQGNIYKLILNLDKIWNEMEKIRFLEDKLVQPRKFLEEFIKWTDISDIVNDSNKICERIVKNITTSGQFIELVERVNITVL